MTTGTTFGFGPFQLDLGHQQLSRDREPIALRPKTWAVLCHLVQQAGRLVPSAELLDQVWPNVAVSPEVLGISVSELRRALDDDRRAPRYVETVHRRGYRFIAEVRATSEPARSAARYQGAAPARGLVGRERELAYLRAGLEAARGGRRRVVLVSGEGGIGKTALVTTFLAEVVAANAGAATVVACGQCIEQYSPSEPFAPLLEALARLCQGADAARLVPVLQRHAPAWLSEVASASLSAAERAALAAEAPRMTPARMLRTLVQALEALTHEVPLVLLLEDLQWSDASTVDLVSHLAQRPDPARLLLLGTYRPVEVLVRGHPLQAVKQRLVAQRLSDELPLDFLSVDAVRSLVAARFPGPAAQNGLAPWLHARTDGNPLFVLSVLDALVTSGVLQQADDGWRLSSALADVGVPESLRLSIERQLAELAPGERRALQGGSIVGISFSAAAVAACVEDDVVAVEDVLADLARRGMLVRPAGPVEWPDGTASAGYTFIHSLHREVLYDRIPPALCRRGHQRVGERLAAVFGDHARAIVNELAVHFGRAGDPTRAAAYHQRAAEHAIARHAQREAVVHLAQALTLGAQAPGAAARALERVQLLHLLGTAQIAVLGYAANEVIDTYRAALALLDQAQESPQGVLILGSLSTCLCMRGEYPEARAVGERALALAEQLGLPELAVGVLRSRLATVVLYSGELAAGHALGEAALACFADPSNRMPVSSGQRMDSYAAALSHDAFALSLLGRLDQGRARQQQAVARARELGHPFTSAFVLAGSAMHYAALRDWEQTTRYATEAAAVCTEYGFEYWGAAADMMRGQALVGTGRPDEAIPVLEQGLARALATGTRFGHPFQLGVLANAYRARGDLGRAESTIRAALAEAGAIGERLGEPELHRIHAEVLWQAGDTRTAESEAALRRSLALARRLGHTLAQLRISVDLARFLAEHQRRDQARALLAPIYASFTEGFDSSDLRSAQATLAAL